MTDATDDAEFRAMRRYQQSTGDSFFCNPEPVYYHTDRDGNRKLLSDLETSHLENIVRHIRREGKIGYSHYIDELESRPAATV